MQHQNNACHLPRVSETHSLTQLLKQVPLENLTTSPCFPTGKLLHFHYVVSLHSVTLPSLRSQADTSFYFSESRGLVIFVIPESWDEIKAWVQCIREIAGYPAAEIIKLKLSFSEWARDLT